MHNNSQPDFWGHYAPHHQHNNTFWPVTSILRGPCQLYSVFCRFGLYKQRNLGWNPLQLSFHLQKLWSGVYCLDFVPHNLMKHIALITAHLNAGITDCSGDSVATGIYYNLRLVSLKHHIYLLLYSVGTRESESLWPLWQTMNSLPAEVTILFRPANADSVRDGKRDVGQN